MGGEEGFSNVDRDEEIAVIKPERPVTCMADCPTKVAGLGCGNRGKDEGELSCATDPLPVNLRRGWPDGVGHMLVGCMAKEVGIVRIRSGLSDIGSVHSAALRWRDVAHGALHGAGRGRS
jgi:hypothetical protein